MTNSHPWRALAANLPPFSLAHSAPLAPASAEQLQAYLAFYQINFYPALAQVHRFGGLLLGGYRIATHYWAPAAPRGTLVLLHGYYDHVGIYGKAIRFALENQLAVVAFDLPGHGLSGGERVAIDRFDSYADVLAALLEQLAGQLPGPYYALGQSTGAAVLLNHLWRYPAQAASFARIALCSPLLLPCGWRMGRVAYSLLRPFVSSVVRSRSVNSHDATFLRFIASEDPLQDKRLSLQWVGAMKAWDAQFRAFAPLPRPLLVVQGSGDKTVAWRYNLQHIQQQLPNAQIALVEGAGHQLVNESDDYRQQVFLHIHRYFFN